MLAPSSDLPSPLNAWGLAYAPSSGGFRRRGHGGTWNGQYSERPLSDIATWLCVAGNTWTKATLASRRTSDGRWRKGLSLRRDVHLGGALRALGARGRLRCASRQQLRYPSRRYTERLKTVGLSPERGCTAGRLGIVLREDRDQQEKDDLVGAGSWVSTRTLIWSLGSAAPRI